MSSFGGRLPRGVLRSALCGVLVLAGIGLAATPLDVRKIADLARVPATVTADGVVRISWTRADVAVKVDCTPLAPFAGMTTWAAFSPTPLGATVAGETILFADEVDAAMDAAFVAGLDVTALHSHFFYDEPKVYSMHIGGENRAEKLVVAVKSVWDAVEAVRRARAQPATTCENKVPRLGRVDARQIERIVGRKTETLDRVVKVTISRDGVLRGTKITSTMGLASWAAFSGEDSLAAMNGEVILTLDEVQPVLRAMRKEGIHVVGLYNHLIGEQPQFLFARFWAKGKADDLAKAFASVLTAQKDASKPGNVLRR